MNRKYVIVITGEDGFGRAAIPYMPKEYHYIVAGDDVSELMRTTADIADKGYRITAKHCNLNDTSELSVLVSECVGTGDEIVAVLNTHVLYPTHDNSPEDVIVENASLSKAVIDFFRTKLSENGVILNLSDVFYTSPADGFDKTNIPNLMQHVFQLQGDDFVSKMLFMIRMLRSAKRTEAAYATSKRFILWYTRYASAHRREHEPRFATVSVGLTKHLAEMQSSSISYYRQEVGLVNKDDVGRTIAMAALENKALNGVNINADNGLGARIWLDDCRVNV